MSSEDSSARLDDIALVRRIVAGERELFRSIVEAHEATIYRMIRRQVNNQTTARDLTQETFLRAYRGLAQFRGSATMSPRW